MDGFKWGMKNRRLEKPFLILTLGSGKLLMSIFNQKRTSNIQKFYFVVWSSSTLASVNETKTAGFEKEKWL